jgi:hypothetical protein
MRKPIPQEWKDRMNAAFNAGDAKALGAALDEAVTEGRWRDFKWEEGLRLAANARDPGLFMSIATRWSKRGAPMASGRSWLCWVALNAQVYGHAGAEKDTAMSDALIDWSPVDAPLATKEPQNLRFSGKSDRESAQTQHAAQMAWRLIHVAAQDGNAQLMARLMEKGADLDGHVEPRGARGGQEKEVLSKELPLAVACRSGNLDVAKMLVRHGARLEMPAPAENAKTGFNPLNWVRKKEKPDPTAAVSASVEIQGQAINPKADSGVAIEWARLALETLAVSDKPPGEQSSFRQDAASAVLLIARLAKEALTHCAQAIGAARPSFDRPPALSAPAGSQKSNFLGRSVLARWAGFTARRNDGFFMALAKRDPGLMEIWAKQAKEGAAASGAGDLDVAGAHPIAWVLALSLAEETRERGVAETQRLGALGAERFPATGGRDSPSTAPKARALLGPLLKGLDEKELMQKICPALANMKPLSAVALCHAPQTLQILLDAASELTGASETLVGDALKNAAAGHSLQCAEILAPRASVEEAMGAGLVWAMAKKPDAARSTLGAARRAERANGAPSKATDKTAGSPFSLDEQAKSLADQAELFAQSEQAQERDWRMLAAEYDSLRVEWAAREGDQAQCRESTDTRQDPSCLPKDASQDASRPSRGPRRV